MIDPLDIGEQERLAKKKLFSTQSSTLPPCSLQNSFLPELFLEKVSES